MAWHLGEFAADESATGGKGRAPRPQAFRATSAALPQKSAFRILLFAFWVRRNCPKLMRANHCLSPPHTHTLATRIGYAGPTSEKRRALHREGNPDKAGRATVVVNV